VRLRIALSLVAAASLVLPLGGCGSDTTSTTSTAVETIEKPANLPAGWTRHTNKLAGFTVGVPPGWTIADRGQHGELRSPDQLAAVSISADRTNEVLDVPLDQLATATISAGVPGLRDVKPGSPRKFRGHYDAVALKATGVGGDQNVPERLLLVILRRPGIATFTVLAAENAKNHPHFYDTAIREIVRSLRSRPITPPSLGG
jgi:hypothetical protein